MKFSAFYHDFLLFEGQSETFEAQKPFHCKKNFAGLPRRHKHQMFLNIFLPFIFLL